MLNLELSHFEFSVFIYYLIAQYLLKTILHSTIVISRQELKGNNKLETLRYISIRHQGLFKIYIRVFQRLDLSTGSDYLKRGKSTRFGVNLIGAYNSQNFFLLINNLDVFFIISIPFLHTQNVCFQLNNNFINA